MDHDTKYKGVTDIRYLFKKDKDSDEDYYRLELINTAFKNNYFHYQTGSNGKHMLSPNEYFKKDKPALIKLINKHKNSHSHKIQLAMKVILTPIQVVNDERKLFAETKNVEMIHGSNSDEVFNELLDSLTQKSRID